MTRRALLRAALALPAGSYLANYEALVAASKNHVKITDIKAMKTNVGGNCLVKVETDAGLVGYGEAGSSGPMARARIDLMKRLLVGQDPLAIERHFHEMTTLMHTYMAHIPTISGIDIALWDLAGKITGLPVYQLLGGPFRDEVSMYSHGSVTNMLDKAQCREWAEYAKQHPQGFTAYKFDVMHTLGLPPGRYTETLDPDQLRKIRQSFLNVREAVGDEIAIAAHCHNELDSPSSIAFAKAIEPMDPLFLEDPLNPPFSEAWMALRRSTRIPLLTGEKLEMVGGFKPFVENQAVDYIHPDLAFAGGITGVKKIADFAAVHRTPLALHNVGTLVLTMASAHFAASIHNFFRSESMLGRPTRLVEKMAAGEPPAVKQGKLKVPQGPGLGAELDLDHLRTVLREGEPWWG